MPMSLHTSNPAPALAPCPPLQKEVVMRCRQAGKPVIVAAHLLQSMHTLPTPTRAEVGRRKGPGRAQCSATRTASWLHTEPLFQLSRKAGAHARIRLPALAPTGAAHTAPHAPPASFPPRQVSDIADCVRQQADALMLCGETAAGAYPLKSLEVLRSVATRIEEWMR